MTPPTKKPLNIELPQDDAAAVTVLIDEVYRREEAAEALSKENVRLEKLLEECRTALMELQANYKLLSEDGGKTRRELRELTNFTQNAKQALEELRKENSLNKALAEERKQVINMLAHLVPHVIGPFE